MQLILSYIRHPAMGTGRRMADAQQSVRRLAVLKMDPQHYDHFSHSAYPWVTTSMPLARALRIAFVTGVSQSGPFLYATQASCQLR